MSATGTNLSGLFKARGAVAMSLGGAYGPPLFTLARWAGFAREREGEGT